MVDFHALANAVTGRLNIDVPPEAEVFVIAGTARFEIASLPFLPVPAFALFLRKTREILQRKYPQGSIRMPKAFDPLIAATSQESQQRTISMRWQETKK